MYLYAYSYVCVGICVCFLNVSDTFSLILFLCTLGLGSFALYGF